MFDKKMQVELLKREQIRALLSTYMTFGVELRGEEILEEVEDMEERDVYMEMILKAYREGSFGSLKLVEKYI